MAAPSPVIIESSPDQAYPALSITPDNARPSGNTASTTRSSPQLLSPSAFTRPRAQLLKSGSKAQQVPAGAHTGFASAASIWKVQADEEQAKGAAEDETRAAIGREDGEHTSEKKPAGKLARPKRAPRPRKTTAAASIGSESPKFDSFIESKANTVAVSAEVSGPSFSNKENPPEVPATSRRPSINISEYSFNADAVPNKPAKSTKSAPIVKKHTARKRASKTDDDKAKEPAPKKLRKPKAKSEAIILDSDEPEPPLFDADRDVEDLTVHLDETVAKKPRSKAAKRPEARAAKTDATASGVSKTTKRCNAPEPCVRETTEKSVYFAQQKPSAALDRLPSSPPLPPCVSDKIPQPKEFALADIVATTLAAEIPLPPTEPAPRRRRSWTPVKDSLAENTTNTLPIVNYELNERMGQTAFSEMLGSFNFMQSETVPVPRAANGEASTKRRRVELSDVPQHAQSVDKPKAKAAPKPPKVKKPKAVPKKPQTITDRATEAYRPLKEADPEQSTISAHFTPRKEVEVAAAERDGTAQEETATKVKKPRKSRAKVQPLEDNAAVPTKAKAKPKTTKVKVKFDKKDHQAPLCSPTQALKQMKSQDFLFGTSSQLATEESPDFIRDIQLAVRQSEMAFAMPNSSQLGTQLDPDAVGEGKSYAGVPTAPHGTCLSIEQARRELWCVSARDETGSQLAQEPKEPHYDAVQPASERPVAQIYDTITISSSAPGIYHEPATTTTEQVPPPTEASKLHAIEIPEALKDRDELPTLPAENTGRDQPTTLESNVELKGDDWMLLQSDDSVCYPQAARCPPPERPAGLATSPARRTVLQALDANIPLAGPGLLSKPNFPTQVRSLSTTVPSPERTRSRKPLLETEQDDDVQIVPSPKRGRGRPRKEPLLEAPAQTSPARGRGRPRKEVSLERTTQTSPARGRGRPRKNSLTDKPVRTSPPRNSLLHELMALPSPKRPVGRPRKVTAQSDAISPARAAGSIRQEEPVISTQPQPIFRKIPSPRPRGSASQKQTPRKEWTHIDEIFDSDSPATPSPKRRRASSSPAFIRPLDFDAPPEQPPPPQTAIPKATTNPTSATAALKPTDPAWPAIQTALFPQITHTITSAPPSGKNTDLTAPPTWHEKILLYDPIVLEDLTAWLNSQGVRTEIERLKVKVKTRGRKKKDAPPEVDEWEVVRDEVRAWMVQKWCEENSVCCLWREGLRGGVKGRY